MTDTTEEPREALAPRNDFPIQLSSFEGPLDLLLFLIRRNEVDIYDIPIAKVTHQYLDVLRTMEHLALDIAGEFFVMAATLLHIKSRVLLPAIDMPEQPDEEDEGADPRWELVQQLLEYKKYKEVAERLRDAIERQRDFLPRLYKYTDDPQEARPLKPSDRIELWNAYNLVLRRIAERLQSGEIRDEQITTAERMEDIITRVSHQRRFSFEDLLDAPRLSPGYVVSTFLALLELARLDKIRLVQDIAFGDIWCEAVEETSSTNEPIQEENL